MPVRHAVEVAHARPDPVAPAVDDAGDKDARHDRSAPLARRRRRRLAAARRRPPSSAPRYPCECPACRAPRGSGRASWRGCRPRCRCRTGASRSAAPARGSAAPSRSPRRWRCARHCLPNRRRCRPSSCRMRMSSIFSIGLTLSRTMPSIRSSSLRLNSEARAGSVSTFSASLMSFCASASTAARTRSASAAMRVSSAAFSAISTSTVWRRRATSVSRTVMICSSRLGGAGLGVLGLGLRRRFFERLLIEGDGLLHQRGLDDPLALDLELAQVALARRCAPRRCRVRRRCGRARYPRARRSRLRAEPGRARSPAARSSAGVRAGRRPAPARARRRSSRSAAWRRSRPAAHGVGVDALGALGGERDRALLVGDLDCLLLLDVEHLARLLRGDAIGLERELDRRCAGARRRRGA